MSMYGANIILAILGIVLAIVALFGIISYIFCGIGYYTLAKRRGIHHAWLAWIPIGGQAWIQGCLADQYVYLAEGKKWYFRHILLWGNLAVLLFSSSTLSSSLAALQAQYMTADFTAFALGSSAFGGLVSLLSLALAVFSFIALYKVYKSCNPQNAVLFLVLSILFGITMPFFLFACRNKDLGMPPAGGSSPEETQPDPEQ